MPLKLTALRRYVMFVTSKRTTPAFPSYFTNQNLIDTTS
jgi:hypothetical protein